MLDETLRRFRYGVQVNSLGLTEAQPENNVIRIVLESLGVTLSKNARCRALQLPAWNEALGLPRPWDQQWSLRIQQILAYETDLLEYEDLFDGSRVVEARTAELKQAARRELENVLGQGGVVAAVESAYMKQRLVESQSARTQAIESGEQVVVGVNRVHGGRAVPAARRGAVLPRGRRLGRARADRAAARLPRAPQPARGDGGAPEPEGRAGCRRQRDAGEHPGGARGRHHRRVGRRAARALRRVPRAHRRRPATRRPPPHSARARCRSA